MNDAAFGTPFASFACVAVICLTVIIIIAMMNRAYRQERQDKRTYARMEAASRNVAVIDHDAE